jgi:hypothetical protein
MQEELWFRCLDGVATLTSTTLQAQHAFHIAKSWLALTATVNSLTLVFVLGGGYYGHGLWGAGGGAGIGLESVLLIMLVPSLVRFAAGPRSRHICRSCEDSADNTSSGRRPDSSLVIRRL